jgi:hypothetical protein
MLSPELISKTKQSCPVHRFWYHEPSGMSIVQAMPLRPLHFLRLLWYRAYQLHDLALILSSNY